ncbi:MAG: RecQ family ATP-dependent DNA helicase [Verrucomicrobia bacterium]|nr:RecQ family ATP-dependent DNA helicase [Cytophagales bacterium]
MQDSNKDIHQLLKQYWGYDVFRPFQENIIQSVLEGKDTLALLPTGGGKSICFQIPALAKEGLCIVVSPLIALIKDQVENLKKRDIQAVGIYSGMSKREIDIAIDNCVYGNIKFLYLSPERLKTEIFLARLPKMKVNLLAIDEAHCISQWGYDFRPSYLQIAQIHPLIPQVPVLALTASATPEVRQDIMQQLEFRSENLFQKSFARANLSYSVLPEEDKERKLLQILQNIPGTAVIYVRSRKRTQEIAQFLSKSGIPATFYHAGLDFQERSKRQENWLHNQVRVMVATNAFGMGIDKPDVRVVVHIDLPDNLESYYQEAGRAGRDEQKAYAVVLGNEADIADLKQRIIQQYPDNEFIRKVYQGLANFLQVAIGSGEMASYNFDMEDFQKLYNFPSIQTYHALKRLEETGLIQFNEAFYQPSRLHINVGETEIYRYRVAHAQFDLMIQVVLRMYGGELFTNYLQISEAQLSQNLQRSVADVEKNLDFLHQEGIISYEKQNNHPKLTFMTPRLDVAKLPQSVWQHIETRKQIYLHRVLAMVAYAENDFRCRTQMILEYFGEITDAVCGVCDVCVKKRRLQTLQAETFAYYRNKILLILNGNSMDLQSIFQRIPQAKEQDFLNVVQQLVGKGELTYEKDGRLCKQKA